MSDIIQAAKWMKQGKRVRCKGWANRFFRIWSDNDEELERTICGSSSPNSIAMHYEMDLDDLLAKDWEIVEASK